MVSSVLFGGTDGNRATTSLVKQVQTLVFILGVQDFEVLEFKGVGYGFVVDFVEDGDRGVVDHDTLGHSDVWTAILMKDSVDVHFENDTAFVGLRIFGVVE